MILQSVRCSGDGQSLETSSHLREETKCKTRPEIFIPIPSKVMGKKIKTLACFGVVASVR